MPSIMSGLPRVAWKAARSSRRDSSRARSSLLAKHGNIAAIAVAGSSAS